MYDKVKLWIDRAIVGDQYPTIANYLDSARQETDLKTGEVKTFGNKDGLKVSIYAGCLSIVGSLPKYLFGSNIYPLDRHTTPQAIEKISDALHIPVKEANVTEVEFGTIFLMKRPVSDYLTKLGAMPRLDRVLVTTGSLRYEGRSKGKQPKVFAFYDKVADAAAKGLKYPTNLQEANLL